MTQEEKELLLQDLCARLPYGVNLYVEGSERLPDNEHISVGFIGGYSLNKDVCQEFSIDEVLENLDDGSIVKLYLRPMSSMTEEEKEEYCDLQGIFLCSSQYPVTDAYELFNWLNAHHFDYRGLIEKGLAIEVTEENNPYEN